MNRATDIEEIDYLLVEWYEWSATYRPKMGVPRVAPYCQQARSSRQWDDATEASCGRLHVDRMTKVEFCIDQLPTGLQRAIGTEMRNRLSTAKVWRDPAGNTFGDAVAMLIPIARKNGLFS